ncbi:MAG TPA: ABC transporter permease [Candidatus Binatia bacterium]|nr:ABC transporter permease [Candidatus Binatia bacterium]
MRLRRFVSNVLAIAYKEAALLRHDRTLVQNVLLQPVIMLLVFGFAMSFKPKDVPWAVFDRSETAISRRLVSEIQASGYFAPPVRVTSYDTGHELLKTGRAVALLVIPKDLRRDVDRGRPQVQLLLDGTDPLTAARVGGYISQIAGNVRDGSVGAARMATGPSPATDPTAAAGVALRQQFRFNPTLRDLDFYLSALAGFLLTNLCLAAASLGLVAERENGTYEQLLAQPTRPLEVVLGKLVPNVVSSYAALALALLGAGFFYGYWPKGNVLLLAIVTLPFILATLSIGVFVSALARTSAQAVFIAVFFIMPSFVLSGSMLPYQLMPHGVREVGALFPLRWYQIISRRIIERGASLAEVAIPTVALLALFGAMLALIRWRMKPRLG